MKCSLKLSCMRTKMLTSLHRGTKDKAFTLPELLLAAAIMAFALSGLISLFISCNNLSEANRNLSAAASHVQFVMENIKDTPFANIKTLIDGGNWTWNASAINTNGLTALRDETITTQASGTRPLEVTVTATWQNRNGRTQGHSIKTLFQ